MRQTFGFCHTKIPGVQPSPVLASVNQLGFGAFWACMPELQSRHVDFQAQVSHWRVPDKTRPKERGFVDWDLAVPGSYAGVERIAMTSQRRPSTMQDAEQRKHSLDMPTTIQTLGEE